MRRPSNRAFLVVGVLVALLLAGVVSFYASTSPDGLNRVAEDHGISKTEKQHATQDGPMAHYRATGVGNERMSRLVAGVTGSLVVLGLFGGLTLVLRRRTATDEADGAGHGDSEPEKASR